MRAWCANALARAKPLPTWLSPVPGLQPASHPFEPPCQTEKKPTMKFIASTALASLALPALAHEGHGLSGSHWHASDTLGFVILGLGLAAALWFSGRGK